MSNTAAATKKNTPEWVEIVRRYQTPDWRRSVWQIVNSGVPFFLIWVLMYYSLQVSYGLTLALALLNGMFLMRLFIIQHDCGHNAFFKSTKVNNIVGSLLGIITLTPYYHWRKAHAKHHAGSGDLDFRGIGDIDTLTVQEYEALSLKGKFWYRFYRHPLIMFVVGPTLVFAIMHRLPVKLAKGEQRERVSVHNTNLGLLAVFLLLGTWLGFKEVLMMWIPLTVFSSVIGVYLFYVQHQFEDTYWRWHEEWDYKDAALQGSSFFKLPKVLQWFSGNIGFHHVHHLSPKIPNYNLEKAHYENEIFQQVETITLKSSFRTVFLDLWDEKTRKLISFREYRKMLKQQSAQAA
ncbi:MAG: fatty acid desaturase [Chloroflexi bacterium]|nr:fatty acid desaturase [Chloroflexota bacterium]